METEDERGGSRRLQINLLILSHMGKGKILFLLVSASGFGLSWY